MNDYRTCTHTYDNGSTCNSAAVKDRDFCCYHLRHRGRQMRSARARARNQRLFFQMPPLEDMFAVQSALTQLVEAVTADMIDTKRAQIVLASLRFAAKNLQSTDKWTTSVYHNDHAPAYDSFEAEFDLPEQLDLNLPPEVAFPPPPAPVSSDLSSGAEEPALSLSKGPAFSPGGARAGLFPNPMPTVSYCKDGPGCPEHTIRADFPVTPEAVEIVEVAETLGSDAAARRGGQLSRNRQRRLQRSDRKRYAAIALERNMRLAAERLAEQKLAAERTAAQAPTDESGMKKPPASNDNALSEAVQKEA